MRAAWTTATFLLTSCALGLSFKAPVSLPVGQPVALATLTDDRQATITSDHPDLIEVVGDQLLVKWLTPSGVTVTLRAKVGDATATHSVTTYGVEFSPGRGLVMPG